MALLDAFAELVDSSDGCDNFMGLGVDVGGVITCAAGAHRVGGVLGFDVIREKDRGCVGVSGFVDCLVVLRAFFRLASWTATTATEMLDASLLSSLEASFSVVMATGWYASTGTASAKLVAA